MGPSDEQRDSLHEALVRDAGRIQEPPFDAPLHREAMSRIWGLADAGPERAAQWWKPALAAASALVVAGICLALWLTRGAQSLPQHTFASGGDFNVTLASTQAAVANFSVDTTSMPVWMSPTASLLNR